MEFQCRICGSVKNPKKHDTYWYCAECGVIFKRPEMFTEKMEFDTIENEPEVIKNEEPQKESNQWWQDDFFS